MPSKAILASLLLFSSSNISASQAEPIDPALRIALEHALAQPLSTFSDQYDAQVWLTSMAARLEHLLPDPYRRVELLRLIHSESRRAGLKPELVLAVIHVESSFNRYAISNRGARGLMQVMPFWKKEIGHPRDSLFIPKTNLRYGCTILKHYMEMERGNTRLALARYNGSLGSNRYPDKVLGALHRHWKFD